MRKDVMGDSLDVQLIVAFLGLVVISIVGIVRWPAVISGERDLYPRMAGVWKGGEATLRAYARCFPTMVLMVWSLTLSAGLVLASDFGLLPASDMIGLIGFAPFVVLIPVAAGIALVNRPSFLVPRSKRAEPGLLHRRRRAG